MLLTQNSWCITYGRINC